MNLRRDSQCPIEVFYDGACPICSRESRMWKKRDKRDLLRFIDISAPGFSAESYGLDSARINEVMHIKTADGEIKTAFEAILFIWKSLS